MHDKELRVKYYGKDDLTCGINLEEAARILDRFESFTVESVNDALELWNIKQFFENGCRLVAWNDETFHYYNKRTEEIYARVARFFSALDELNLETVYKSTDIRYREDFWAAFEKYSVSSRVSDAAFEAFVKNNSEVVGSILTRRKIVEQKGKVLADILRDPKIGAKYIITKHLINEEGALELFLPKELSAEEKANILNDYISLSDARVNDLEVIWQAQSSKELPLSDKTRQKAALKYTAFWEKREATSPSFTLTAHVSFVSLPDSEKEVTYKDGTFFGKYSKEWIAENLDYPTLLNNFIYLFEYTDLFFRSNFAVKEQMQESYTLFLGRTGKKEYPRDSVFDILRGIASVQMGGYCDELRRNGIEIEDLFKWFFEVYLPQEFGAIGFVYTAPSKQLSALEKCRSIISEMDGLLKQYRMYCQDGEIDRALFEMSSGQTVFKTLPSMQSRKYGYAKSTEIKNEMALLFSMQSFLASVKDETHSEDLASYINENHVRVEDFFRHQQNRIRWLIERGALYEDDSGCLHVNNKRVALLRDLYENGTICVSYCRAYSAVLEALEAQNDICIESTLFSKKECDYLNYILNKSEYSNGLDLRNRYSHGTFSLNEKEHATDYLEFLKIMVLIIIKINEEFCLAYPLPKM